MSESVEQSVVADALPAAGYTAPLGVAATLKDAKVADKGR